MSLKFKIQSLRLLEFRIIIPVLLILIILKSCISTKEFRYYFTGENYENIGTHTVITPSDGEEIIVTTDVLFGNENKILMNIKTSNINSINVFSSQFGNFQLNETKDDVDYFSKQIDQDLTENQFKEMLKKDTITIYFSENEKYQFVQN